MYEIGEGISAAAGYSNQKWKPDLILIGVATCGRWVWS
jgi:hypothetical protein